MDIVQFIPGNISTKKTVSSYKLIEKLINFNSKTFICSIVIRKFYSIFDSGGGFIQITGRANYQELTNDTGIDFVANPDIITQESNALISALWFWKKNNFNDYSCSAPRLKVLPHGESLATRHRTKAIKDF